MPEKRIRVLILGLMIKADIFCFTIWIDYNMSFLLQKNFCELQNQMTLAMNKPKIIISNKLKVFEYLLNLNDSHIL